MPFQAWILLLLLAAVACGGDDGGDAEGDVLDISEAAEASPGELATVRGFVVVDAGGSRLCEALAESFPRSAAAASSS